MQTGKEEYEQLSIFVDQKTNIDENGHKTKWTIRDYAKRKAKTSPICSYKNEETGECMLSSMIQKAGDVVPYLEACGTISCPYYISYKIKGKGVE